MEAKAAPGTVELTARHCPAQLGKDREQEPSALSLQTLLPNLITSLMKAFDFLVDGGGPQEFTKQQRAQSKGCSSRWGFRREHASSVTEW